MLNGTCTDSINVVLPSRLICGQKETCSCHRIACPSVYRVLLQATKPIWIISDARRPTDLTYFQTRYPTISVRVQCPDSVRAARRWVFTPGVDDAASECGLDKREWDIVIDNDGDAQKLEEQLSELIQLVTVHCRTSTGQPML
eukprot:m.197444 g.197444  ORF g.197444 m.197444 type:complete len:143 (-) comp18720_c0_seq1:197-625(-)